MASVPTTTEQIQSGTADRNDVYNSKDEMDSTGKALVPTKELDIAAQFAGLSPESFDEAVLRRVRWKIDCWVLPLLA